MKKFISVFQGIKINTKNFFIINGEKIHSKYSELTGAKLFAFFSTFTKLMLIILSIFVFMFYPFASSSVSGSSDLMMAGFITTWTFLCIIFVSSILQFWFLPFKKLAIKEVYIKIPWSKHNLKRIEKKENKAKRKLEKREKLEIEYLESQKNKENNIEENKKGKSNNLDSTKKFDIKTDETKKSEINKDEVKNNVVKKTTAKKTTAKKITTKKPKNTNDGGDK